MKKLQEKLFLGFVKAVFVWTILALSFDVSMLVLSAVNPELEHKIGNEIMWKIDGTFSK